jgi:general transcription factor IIIA
LKLHEEREVEEGLVMNSEGECVRGEGEDGEEERPNKKRRRGGEVGRDWKCAVAGCIKDFKSVRSLLTPVPFSLILTYT